MDGSAQSFETAINSLKQVVSPLDAREFQKTSSEDVWKAAEEIQTIQRERKSVRNMRRVEPFLKALEKYSKVIEVLCNGTPYLPWIWAPIKLMLQLASEYTNVFDKLIDAYGQIAEAMPQVDRLQDAFKDDPNFRIVLGMVYSDILEFHRRAYKLFRRRAWHIFFDTLWKAFDTRFQGILGNLSRHKKLLMKEVFTIDVVEARQWRNKASEELKRQEKKNSDFYLHDSIAWLKIADEDFDDELERLADKRQEGTCEWVGHNPLFQKWKDDAHADPVLWVKGIPGAGKTILSTFVIRQLQEEKGFMTAYHICNSYTTGKNLLGEILRSLAVQLLRGNLELAPYIFENYANKGLAPSIVRLRKLLPELLGTIPSVRLIIDGLDEYPESEQRTILAEVLSLSKSPGSQFRVLFSNRESAQINKVLNYKPTICLRDERANVKRDIEAYVRNTLRDLRHRFSNRLVDQIGHEIISKADDMFLWVRLVLQSLEECHSEQELLEAVNSLPEGLDQAYGRILNRFKTEFLSQSSDKAIQILQWVACSFRIMKEHEIKDGIVFHTTGATLNEQTKMIDSFLHLCKPLIEEGPKNTIDFVHYSAKEYILHANSGPFIGYHRAQYDLALSCINYMNSSICFHDENASDTELKLQVLKGYHGLHNYANEFWFKHLLQYAKYDEPVEDEELDEPLDEIEEFWKRAPGEGVNFLKLDDTTSADAIERQIEVLDSMPLARKMGFDIVTFQKFLSQEKFSHLEPDRLKDEELRHDPTFFSATSQRYQEIVRFLIDCSFDDLPEGAQPVDLTRFKATYIESAFICRYRECPRYSDGFASAVDRDKHEALHAKPLRCADPSCDLFARGFSSKTGLQNHNRKWHPLPEETALPKFEPRKPPEPVYRPPTPPPLPPPPPPRAETPPPPSPKAPERQVFAKPVKQPRISRAKRNLRVHTCNVCNKVYSRNEGLRRHQLSHERPRFFCEWDGCNKAFHRLDLLTRHNNLAHTKPVDEPPQVEMGSPLSGSGDQDNARLSHPSLSSILNDQP